MDSLNIHMELDLALFLGKKLINQGPDKGKGLGRKELGWFIVTPKLPLIKKKNI